MIVDRRDIADVGRQEETHRAQIEKHKHGGGRWYEQSHGQDMTYKITG